MNHKKDKKQELLATFFVSTVCFVYVLVFGKPDIKHKQSSNSSLTVSTTSYISSSKPTPKTAEASLAQHAVLDSIDPIPKSSSGSLVKKLNTVKTISTPRLTSAPYQMPPSTEKSYQSLDEQNNPLPILNIKNKNYESPLDNPEPLDEHANDETMARGSIIALNTQKAPPSNKSQPKSKQSQTASMKKLHQSNTTAFNTTQTRTKQQQSNKSDSSDQQKQASNTNTQENTSENSSPEDTDPISKERPPYGYTVKIDPGLCLEEKYFDESDALLRIQGSPDYNDHNFDHTDKQIQSLGFNGTLTVKFLPNHKVLDKPGVDFSIHVPTPKTLGKRRRADIYVQQDKQDIHLGHIAMGTHGSGKAGFDLELFGIDSIDAIMIVDAEQLSEDDFNYCQKEVMPYAGFAIDSIELTHYFEQTTNEI